MSDCNSIASSQCSCENRVFCDRHLPEHMRSSSNPHSVTSLVSMASENDISAIEIAIKQPIYSHITSEIGRCKEAIAKLVREINDMQKELSLRIESIFKMRNKNLLILKEIEQNKMIPNQSENSFIASLTSLKEQNNLNSESVKKCLDSSYNALILDSRSQTNIPPEVSSNSQIDRQHHRRTLSQNDIPRPPGSVSQNLPHLPVTLPQSDIPRPPGSVSQDLPHLPVTLSQSDIPCPPGSVSQDLPHHPGILSQNSLPNLPVNSIQRTTQANSYSHIRNSATIPPVLSQPNLQSAYINPGRNSQIPMPPTSMQAYQNISINFSRVTLMNEIMGAHMNSVCSVATYPGIFATASYDKTIKFWNTATYQLLFTLNCDAIQCSINFCPSGRRIVSGDQQFKAVVWKLETMQAITTYNRHNNWVCSVAFSPDGSRIVSGSDDKSIHVWGTESGQVLLKITENLETVKQVLFTRDGNEIVSGSQDGTIKFWSAYDGTLQKSINAHNDAVTSIAINQDYLISGSKDRLIKLWKLSGEHLETFPHSNEIKSLDFSDSGQVFVSGSKDNTMGIWSLRGGLFKKTLRSSVHAKFSGNHIIAGTSDNAIQIYKLE